MTVVTTDLVSRVVGFVSSVIGGKGPRCRDLRQEAASEVGTVTIGALRYPAFATNPNKPLPGTSLYRYSSGHGQLYWG